MKTRIINEEKLGLLDKRLAAAIKTDSGVDKIYFTSHRKLLELKRKLHKDSKILTGYTALSF